MILLERGFYALIPGFPGFKLYLNEEEGDNTSSEEFDFQMRLYASRFVAIRVVSISDIGIAPAESEKGRSVPFLSLGTDKNGNPENTISNRGASEYEAGLDFQIRKDAAIDPNLDLLQIAILDDDDKDLVVMHIRRASMDGIGYSLEYFAEPEVGTLKEQDESWPVSA